MLTKYIQTLKRDIGDWHYTKEQYSPTAHRSLNQIVSSLGGNKVLHEKINFCEVWETCDILASTFAPFTCMEKIKNLKGTGSRLELSIQDQLSYTQRQ